MVKLKNISKLVMRVSSIRQSLDLGDPTIVKSEIEKLVNEVIKFPLESFFIPSPFIYLFNLVKSW